MSLSLRRLRSFAVAACLAFVVALPSAQANVDLELDWWVDGLVAADSSVVGTDLGNGMFNYAGDLMYLNPMNPFEMVTLSFNLNGKPDPNVGMNNAVLISGNITVENMFSSEIDVRVLLELPLKNPLLPTTTVSGSAAVGLTTEGAGSVASLGVPVWQGLTDGTPLGAGASFFLDPYSLDLADTGSVGDSGNIVPFDGGAIVSSIGIDLNFSLTPLDQTSFTSVLGAIPVPAPGAFVVLAAAGLIVRRRRR
jgi:hypothetical protein